MPHTLSASAKQNPTVALIRYREAEVAGAELRSNGRKQIGNDARFITRAEAVRNAVWVIETRDFHRLETTPASLDPAPDRRIKTALIRSHIDGADLDFVQSAKESRRILVRLSSLCNVDETRLALLVRNANQISAARRYC